jgi:hypothetical protein
MRKKKSIKRRRNSPPRNPNEAPAAVRPKSRTKLGVLAGAALLLVGGVAYIYSNWPTRLQHGELISLQSRPAAGNARRANVLGSLQAPPASNVSIRSPMQNVAIQQQMEHADARKGGWDSEALSEQATSQLNVLKKSFEGDSNTSLDSLGSILSDNFSCARLRPVQLYDFFSDADDGAGFRVRRANRFDETIAHLGLPGLQSALGEFLDEVDSTTDVRLDFKVVAIELGDSEFTTRVLVEALGSGSRGVEQRNATWNCRWMRSVDQPPRLDSIELVSHEEVTFRAAGTSAGLALGTGPLMVDVTRSACGHLDNYGGQFLRGIGHWLLRLSSLESISLYGHHGLAIGDVNNDGLDDLYVCDAGGLPNRLYLQNEDGTLRDGSAEAGVDWLEDSQSALLVDLDNDGDQDLVVTTWPLILISENDGQGRFELRGGHAAVGKALSPTAVDYDNDGDLDLYVCGHGHGITGGGPRKTGREPSWPVPYHDATNGGRNVLLENQGGFQFKDVTERVGLEHNNDRWTFAAAWEDYDRDGDMDLYVANDFGRNNLYHNQDGKFRDIAAEAGVEDAASGMSVSWGDFNRDGWPDLYVGNMFSAAGNRVAYQRRFEADRGGDAVVQLQRMARGNTLFAASPNGAGFHDVSETHGVTMGRWAWGSQFVDLNNDSHLDLVVANGFLTSQRQDDL